MDCLLRFFCTSLWWDIIVFVFFFIYSFCTSSLTIANSNISLAAFVSTPVRWVSKLSTLAISEDDYPLFFILARVFTTSLDKLRLVFRNELHDVLYLRLSWFFGATFLFLAFIYRRTLLALRVWIFIDKLGRGKWSTGASSRVDVCSIQ